MQVSVHLDKVRGNALLKSLIERKIKKTEAYLKPFHPGMVDLSVYLYYQSRSRLFECKAVLKLPTSTIIGQKKGFSSFEAVSKSFKTLYKEITSHKKKLKHENEYNSSKNLISPVIALDKLNDIPELERIKTSGQRDEFLKQVANSIQGYIYFAEKEIQKSEVELFVNLKNLVAEEIVDSAIIEVYTLLDEGKIDHAASEKSILQMIRQKIEKAAQKKISDRPDEISLNSRITDPTVSGDDMFDYYQPDASWRLEDVYSNPNSRMIENLLDEPEAMMKLELALKELQPQEKQIFYLYFNQGYSVEEVCEILDCHTKQLKEHLARITDKLQAIGIDMELI